MILDGKSLAEEVKAKTAEDSYFFQKKYGRKPFLAVVLVGDNPASAVYVRSKEKACIECNIDSNLYKFNSDVSEEVLLACIDDLNENPLIDGILVQLPLPSHINTNEILNNVSPLKDVDGFTACNAGKVFLGQEGLIPCTPKGVLRILDKYSIPTDGKNVCVIGRSNIVGKPLACLLMQADRNATVTVCNSHTADIRPFVNNADIVVCAVGKPMTVTSDMVKEGAVVIDVGINRIEDSTKKSGYRLCGDSDFEGLKDKVSAITPVPGGVGPMTIAMLMENTVIAANQRQKLQVEDE